MQAIFHAGRPIRRSALIVGLLCCCAVPRYARAAGVLGVSAGSPQSAVVTTAFATNLKVIATDSGTGLPASGVLVFFTAPGGGASGTFASAGLVGLGQPHPEAANPGAVNAVNAVSSSFAGFTLSDGSITAPVFTANTIAGPYSITVTAATYTSTTASLTNLAGPPASIAKVGGDGQSVNAGTAVPVSPSVVVKDAFSNLCTGVAVSFTPAAGSGSVTGSPATTDSSGVATVGSWTLGVTPGTNSLTAAVAALSTVFTATGNAVPPATLDIFDGNNQTQQAGKALPLPTRVIVKDAAKNPVAGVSVTFSIASGGGSIASPVATTDASGIAAPGAWTLGATPGSNTLTAASSGLSTVTFTATGTAPAPATIEILDGNNQTQVTGKALALTTRAIVKDASKNPVAGVAVTFSVASGGGSIAAPVATTGADGIATPGAWTLGPKPGANTLNAAAAGVAAGVVFSATATNSPPVIASFSAAPNPTTVGATVQFTVAASDPEGAPLAISFLYGDGSSGIDPKHVYNALGNFTATVMVSDGIYTVTQQLAIAVVDNGPDRNGDGIVTPSDKDSDGDGFPDDVETAAGTDPLNAGSTPFGNKPAPTVQAFNDLLLEVTLFPQFEAQDKIRGAGSLPLHLAAGDNFKNSVLFIDISGYVQKFTLNSAGYAGTAGNTIALHAHAGKPTQITFKTRPLTLSPFFYSNALLDAKGYPDHAVVELYVKDQIFRFNTKLKFANIGNGGIRAGSQLDFFRR